MEDEEEKNGQTGASTRATSMESKIDTAYLQSSGPREQQKKHDYPSLDTTEYITSFFNRPISSSVPLYLDRVTQNVRENDRRAAATLHLPHAATVPLPLLKQPQDQQGSVSDEEEWEIVMIVGERRTSKSYECKIRWLLGRESGAVSNFKETIGESPAWSFVRKRGSASNSHLVAKMISD